MTDPWSRYDDRRRLPAEPEPARRIDWRQVRRDLGAFGVAAILGIAGLIVLAFVIAVATGAWSPW